METETIRIVFSEMRVVECNSLLIVPKKAVDEPGYIKGLTASKSGHDKHELQALAQTAYFQDQDDELDIEIVKSTISIIYCDETDDLDEGLLIYRMTDGVIKAVICEGLSKRKLLEAAHRFCTRWVRLDI